MYSSISERPIPEKEFIRVIQGFSYPGILRAVPQYFNASTFRAKWLDRRNRLFTAIKCLVVIMEGYNSKTQLVNSMRNLGIIS
jgi:hypothetical protein